MKKRNKELTTTNLILETEGDGLQSRKTALEKSCEELRNSFSQELKTLVSKLIDAGTKVLQTATEASNDISNATTKARREIDEIGQKAKAYTEEYARMQGVLIFAPLIRAINGQSVSLVEIRKCTVFAMQILLAHLAPNSSAKRQLELTITDLKDDLSFEFL